MNRIIDAIKNVSPILNGKESILEMKDANYNWKQTEWAGFYIELQMAKLLGIEDFSKAWGNRYGNTVFDAQLNGVDIDFKVHSIKNANGKNTPNTIICNDLNAIKASLDKNQFIHFIVFNTDFAFDNTGLFKKWHDELKGSVSNYCKKHTGKSRKRKVNGIIQTVNIYTVTSNILNNNDISTTTIFKRNSNGKERAPKLTLKLSNFAPDYSIKLT